MGSLFEEALNKISHFQCVADSLSVGMLREKELGRSLWCRQYKFRVKGIRMRQ
jgi:hypothetical protein